MDSRGYRFELFACVAAQLTCVTPACAQSSQDTGVVLISVVNGANEKPLADARIVSSGATQVSALTIKSGIVKYTDVASGLYHDKQVDVDVTLATLPARATAPAAGEGPDSSDWKVIGRVSARVSITTRDVDADSPIRKASDFSPCAPELGTGGGSLKH